MTGFAKIATDKTLKAWLSAGPVDRGVGDGLTFVATKAGACLGKASWIVRYRHGGKGKEKVIGRYPDIPLKDAREFARKDRAERQRQATKPGPVVLCTFSPARVWRPAVVARLARTLP